MQVCVANLQLSRQIAKQFDEFHTLPLPSQTSNPHPLQYMGVQRG